MKIKITSFVSGIVFALGLGISGMTRPVKIIGFLDFFGNWDPSLAFVMVGALAVYFVAYRISLGMPSPFLAPRFSIPSRSDLDVRLIGGAAIFGAGWGFGGFCPGPALVSIASGAAPVLIFVIAMACGTYLHAWTAKLGQARTAAPSGLSIAADS